MYNVLQYTRMCPFVRCCGAVVAAADPGQDNTVCSAVLPSPGLKRTSAPLVLSSQQLSLLGRTCLTRPGQNSVAASLGIVRKLIHSSDEDLWQTGHHIHPNCPCPPISVLQPLLRGRQNFVCLLLLFI